jgi:hypothetical protein
MKTSIISIFVAATLSAAQSLHAQNWLTTGNTGLTNSNFLGTTDNKNLIFKANNAERGRLMNTGSWRFGGATNFAKIDSTGKLSFGGAGAYQVAGNSYVFQAVSNSNYGLFYNSTVPQYELRNSTAAPIFFVNAENGNGTFRGTLKIGAYILPSTDGTNGQVLTTNGTGTVGWSTISGGTGANKSLSNLSSTAVNVDVLPGGNNTLNLGSANKAWKSIYLDSALYIQGINFISASNNSSLFVGNIGNVSNSGDFNTAIGTQTLYSNATGYDNTGIGTLTLYGNTSGHDNTANGSLALYYNTTGSENTANGVFALFSNIAGNDNTANGYQAFYSNTTGNGNTANGHKALYYSNGDYNTANGAFALSANTTGSDNAANGAYALSANTTGHDNTANGYFALSENTTGYQNTANGSGALASSDNFNSGNSNTATGFETLAHNSTGNNNTANGAFALYANTTGSENTANGHQALFFNTMGVENTANGHQALYSNTTGSNNTANGYNTLGGNKTGNNNTASGYNALSSSNTGDNNTANGYNALWANTSGTDNTASGGNALDSNTTGLDNTANGSYALGGNTEGDYNTADGKNALQFNTIGVSNTGVGWGALLNSRTANDNIAVGVRCLQGNVTGMYNTAIGTLANVNGTHYSNSTAIGYTAMVTADNQVRIGNNSITSIGGYTGWTNISDERVKKNIKENVPGLAFIKLLRPVTYHYDLTAADKIMWPNGKPKTSDEKGNEIRASDDAAMRNAKEQVTYTGFIAQDVDKAAKKLNYDFSGIDEPKNDKDLYGLRYSDFVVPLVKAVQELSKTNDSLKNENEVQQKQNDAQQKQLELLQKEIDELKTMMQQMQQCSPCNGTSASLKSVNSYNAIITDAASLEQNIPNPFTNTTTIGYSLPNKFSSAQIVITDKNGKTLKAINISGAGKGQVNVDASVLASGAYNYALYVDGKFIASKQMVLAK